MYRVTVEVHKMCIRLWIMGIIVNMVINEGNDFNYYDGILFWVNVNVISLYLYVISIY